MRAEHSSTLRAVIIAAVITAVAGAVALQVSETLHATNLVIDTRADVGSMFTVGAPSSPTSLVTLNGSGNQLELRNAVTPAHTLKIINNGSSIWDFDPTSATGSDAPIIRFFRHTTTTGTIEIDVDAGSSSPLIQLVPKGTSLFSNSLRINTAILLVGHPTVSSGTLSSQSSNFAGKIISITGTSTTLTWTTPFGPNAATCVATPHDFAVITADATSSAATFTCYDGSGVLKVCPTLYYWCNGYQ